MTDISIGDFVCDANYRWRRGEVIEFHVSNRVKCVRIKTSRGEHLSIILPNVELLRRGRPQKPEIKT